MNEFQAVILAAGRGSRMYPLCEDKPKALLPVGNQPLIWYPVSLLVQNGFTEAVVVVKKSEASAISEVVAGFRGIKLSLESIPAESDDWGTADSLRYIQPRIKSDVLVLSCDLMTTLSLRQLIDFHRVQDCTLSCLLVRGVKRDTPTEQDLVGVAGSSQLVYFTAQADLDDELTLSRSMLKRHPQVRLFTGLLDSHCYIVKKWTIDYLTDNKDLSSVKGELLPHLVKHQSLTAGASYSKPTKQALQKLALSCVDEMDLDCYKMSSFSGGSREELIRCHALVQETGFTSRINTLAAYTEANRSISQHFSAFGLERPQVQQHWRSKSITVSSDSVVSPSAVLADRVSVKKTCIGDHCTVGERSKVINCVLVDHVHICTPELL